MEHEVNYNRPVCYNYGTKFVMGYLESELSREDLQERTGAVFNSIGRMMEAGFNTAQLGGLERTFPRDHRDFWMVFLGLKPCSWLPNPVTNCYKEYFEFLPEEKDIGIRVSANTQDIKVGYAPWFWNIKMVQEVLGSTPEKIFEYPYSYCEVEIRQGLEKARDEVIGLDAGAGDDEIERKIRSLRFYYGLTNNAAVEGVLLGYPLAAARLFGKFHRGLVEAAENQWRYAKRDGVELSCPEPPKSIADLILNTDGARTQLLDLFERSNHFDPLEEGFYGEMYRYLKGVRLANVPGFGYVTCGDLTRVEELSSRRLFAESGFDVELTRLLDK